MKTKEVKQEELKARTEACNALTPVQRIEKLDKLFGKGKGAKRERERLSKRI